jgi:hypothetical protein
MATRGKKLAASSAKRKRRITKSDDEDSSSSAKNVVEFTKSTEKPVTEEDSKAMTKFRAFLMAVGSDPKTSSAKWNTNCSEEGIFIEHAAREGPRDYTADSKMNLLMCAFRGNTDDDCLKMGLSALDVFLKRFIWVLVPHYDDFPSQNMTP